MKNIRVHLPKIDEEATRAAVEAELEKYLFFKLMDVDEERREAKITASYSERFHGPTNQTSDSTADIAIHNVTNDEYREKHIFKVERAVAKLGKKHQTLIRERYMKEFGIYDVDVYSGIMMIHPSTYTKLRNEAFYILAFQLRVYVEKKEGGEKA